MPSRLNAGGRSTGRTLGRFSATVEFVDKRARFEHAFGWVCIGFQAEEIDGSRNKRSKLAGHAATGALASY